MLGSALVSLVPLAVAMVLFSQHIQRTVRADAAERLRAALGTIATQLQADGQRDASRLEILARDPALKRLYLVRPIVRRDLADYLSEKRFLLGLDFLNVADSSGALVADAGVDSVGPARAAVDTLRAGASPGYDIHGFAGMPALALAASAPIRYQGEVAGTLRGGVVLDRALLARLARTGGIELALRDRDGRVVASTLDPGPGAPAPRAAATGVRRPYLSQDVALGPEGVPGPALIGMVSTAAADRTIAALRLTSVLLGLLGLGIAMALGVLWSLQVSRPVEQLARFSERIAQGSWDEPLRVHSVRELQTLVAALDRMRSDLRGYRERLVASERQAAWSQMARAVAHEIKNPLTPIAVSIADLKRSFELERPDFRSILDQAARTITDEIESLRGLLQEFADFARMPAPRLAPCDLAALLADLGALYGREVADGRLVIQPAGSSLVIEADAGQLRQALVNLVKNALEATERGGRVTVAARAAGDVAELEVADTGPGLSAEQKAGIFAPGFTTKSQGSGLGLTIVERIVSDHRGTIAVESEPGRGATFRLRLPVRRQD
jgi:signal transduction histidine kinase